MIRKNSTKIEEIKKPERHKSANPAKSQSLQKNIPPSSVEWSVPEFEFHTKHKDWYIASLIIAISLIVFGVFTNNFLFIVLVVIAEMLVLFWANEEPPLVHYILNEEGFMIDDKIYSWKSFGWFAILGSPVDNKKELVLQKTSRTAQRLHIPIEPSDLTETIKSIIHNKLNENEDYEKNFVDKLEKIVRF